MNKNIIIKVLKKDDIYKSYIFFPDKLKLCILEKDNDISKLLIDTISLICDMKYTNHIILVSNEIMITNIINDYKKSNLIHTKWSPLINYINKNKVDIQAYTMSD